MRKWYGAAVTVMLLAVVAGGLILFHSHQNQRLLLAAYAGQTFAMERALSRGADVDATGRDGAGPALALTIQMQATERTAQARGVSRREAIDLLIDRGADINKPDRGGRSPLYYAAQTGMPDLVEQLLELGADIEGAGRGTYPLIAAVQTRGHYLYANRAQVSQADQVIELLVRAGANVNAIDHGGGSPLHDLAQQQSTYVNINPLIDLLIEHGGDVNAPSHGRTPLYRAAQYGHAANVRALLAHGAEVDAAGHDGVTPLWIVAYSGAGSDDGRIEVIRLLLKHGADPDVKANNQPPPRETPIVKRAMEQLAAERREHSDSATAGE